MLELNLPAFDIKVKKIDERLSVFDKLRRRYIALTPEEWVRQHFVNYLITEKEYPETLIANEISLQLNNTKRRCDTVIYDTKLHPLVIVEYKAPEIKISQDVFDQIVRYNIVLRVNYLIVSNGISHYCCKMDYENMSYNFLEDIPFYRQLND